MSIRPQPASSSRPRGQGAPSRPPAEASGAASRSKPKGYLGWTILVLVLILVSVGGEFAMTFFGSGGGPAPVASSGEALIGGPFHLIDANGRPVDQRILDGKWSAVFFGYTNCPDTCPATLQALNAARAKLTPAQRRDFQVVFVSVDPARDTPAQMKLYTSSQGYPPGVLVGLTGTPAQVKAAADAYRAVYAKTGTGSDYAVQHSAAVYLMDPQGKFVRPLDEREPPATLAGDIVQAMKT